MNNATIAVVVVSCVLPHLMPGRYQNYSFIEQEAIYDKNNRGSHPKPSEAPVSAQCTIRHPTRANIRIQLMLHASISYVYVSLMPRNNCRARVTY